MHNFSEGDYDKPHKKAVNFLEYLSGYLISGSAETEIKIWGLYVWDMSSTLT